MNLVINKKEITTDSHGRYSLNDLHEAAGGLNSQKPSLFYRSDSFNSVVEVLNAQNRAFSPIVKKQGRYNGGTWVCKELVYKYAMWISAEYEVNVIQTFDSIINKINAPTVMEALNDLTLKIESDSAIASKCGAALAHYKKVKKENTEKWVASVSEAQLTLGLSNDKADI